MAEQRRGCCLLSMAHTAVTSGEVTLVNLCPHWRGALLWGSCYRVVMARAIPLRYNTVQWIGAEQCLEEGSAAAWLGIKPCFWGTMLQSKQAQGPPVLCHMLKLGSICQVFKFCSEQKQSSSYQDPAVKA